MVSIDFLISSIPAFPLIGFLIIALNTKRLGHTFTSTLACGTILLSFLASVYLFAFLLQLPVEDRSLSVVLFDWIKAGSFSAPFSFLIDPLSSVFLLIITGIGFLIHLYSTGYMHDDEGYNRFFGYLNLFIFFMLVLVMGGNYLIMFIGWEGVGLCSYLLIGFWFKNQSYNDAANKAFIMNRVGDLGLLLGIILIVMNFSTLQYLDVYAAATTADYTIPFTAITLLLFIGAMGKSAQIPLYTWLPDAMAGPTPVSALIHAATMVTAGIYMIARNNVLFTLAPTTLHVVMYTGLATALLAATIAVKQNDIKKVLAYSTVSQLGLMFVALGLGAYTTGVFHVVTHAFFKALMFLGAGSVIHALHGEQDIRNMGGLKKYLPITYFTFLLGVLAISGIPPFSGFFSKDEILAQAFAVNPVIWAGVLITSLLTVLYMFRLFFLTFFGSARAAEEKMKNIHESPLSMSIPLIILGALSLLGGFIGIPEVFGGPHALREYLAPVFTQALQHGHHLEHSTELILMAVVVTLTVIIITIGYSKFVRKASVPSNDDVVTSGLEKLLANKYYIDELYHATFVKPLYAISKWTDAIIERLAIDGAVNGIGSLIVWSGRAARYVQRGTIGYYIFVMVLGVACILIINFMQH